MNLSFIPFQVLPHLSQDPTLEQRLWKVWLEIFIVVCRKWQSLLLPITQGVVVNETVALDK